MEECAGEPRSVRESFIVPGNVYRSVSHVSFTKSTNVVGEQARALPTRGARARPKAASGPRSSVSRVYVWVRGEKTTRRIRTKRVFWSRLRRPVDEYAPTLSPVHASTLQIVPHISDAVDAASRWNRDYDRDTRVKNETKICVSWVHFRCIFRCMRASWIWTERTAPSCCRTDRWSRTSVRKARSYAFAYARHTPSRVFVSRD